MAAKQDSKTGRTPFSRILKVLKLDREEISSVYFYAMFNGIIQLSLPLGIQNIIGYVLGGAISTSLVILIILVVIGVFLTGLIRVHQMRIIEKVQQKIFVRYTFDYARRIPELDLKAIDAYYLPEMMNRFFDTVSLQKGISKILLDFPTATIQILFGLLLLSFYHPVFIAFSIVTVSLVVTILYFSGTRGLQTSLEESDYKYGVGGWLEEMSRAILSFKFFRSSGIDMRKTDELVVGYLNARTAHFKILQIQYWTLVGFKVVITAIMLAVGSYLLIDQQLNLGQFIAAEIVILLVLNSVEKLLVNLDKVYDVLTSVEKLSKVIDSPLEQDGTVVLASDGKGVAISMNGVGYAMSDRNVLSDVNVEIPASSCVAVMGRDGSGKSTLLRLLSGIYRDYQGGLTANGIPLRDYTMDSWRANTGILFGRHDIFSGTLLENITMGDPSVSADMLVALIEAVGLKDFLKGLPMGFSTRLDPSGKRLSRSVMQRILLMRALVRGPRLLLLEDPWRGMDDDGRARIHRLLISRKRNATVVVESNDLDFARMADMVLYFSEGRLEYAGPWKEDLQAMYRD
jgi:ABC-type bacteriocin/lantibiotic exporter with double-glycine peptidase domain